MRDAMLPGVGSRIELKQDNHGILQTARSKLVKGLEEAYAGRMFLRNSGWAAAGMLAIPGAIVVVALVTLLIRSGPETPAAIWNMPLIAALALLAAWFCHRMTQGRGCLMVLAWVSMFIAIIVAFFATFITLALTLDGGDWPVLLPLVALPLAFTAFSWMYAPTVEGRALMDRIAGFRQYLGITEEERLDTLHPPEKTPDLFERYLPYAIALDVENRWADKFATVLAAAAVAGTAAHTASWYSGDGNLWDDPGKFASSVGSSLNSTISSASSSPSSSSGGSSGGGSSGGGGGGGGGSGW